MVLLTKEGGGDEKRGLFKRAGRDWRRLPSGTPGFDIGVQRTTLGENPCQESAGRICLLAPLAFSLPLSPGGSSVSGKVDREVLTMGLASRIKRKPRGFEDAKAGPPGQSWPW